MGGWRLNYTHPEEPRAVDIQKLFDEEIPSKFARNPDAAKQIGARYQINITGDGGGPWFIDTTDGGPSVTRGVPGGADAAITISTEDFQKYYESPNTHGMPLFFSGKLRITGNQMLAMKLQQLFTLGYSA